MYTACAHNLACLALVGTERPDCRTISDVRKQPLEAFQAVFGHVVRLAGVAGLVKLGNVSTDGTKLQGKASRPTAMSYGSMSKEGERLREEIAPLVPPASQQGRTGQKRRGKVPKPIEATPDNKAQLSFTDPELESMRMPHTGGIPAATRTRVWTARVRSSWPAT